MTSAQVSTARLDGKVALVTGAGRGIGRGIALELAARGADVIINYANSVDSANDTVKAIEALGRKSCAIKADISDPAAIEKLFSEAKAKYGKLHIAMSNSGIESFEKIEDVTPEVYDRVFNLNTRAQFFVARAAYKHLEEGGRVILMSSIAAHTRLPKHHSLYAGSKSAVEGFVRCMSTDFGDRRITVNGIAPGGVKTDMFAHAAYRYIPHADSSWTGEMMEKALAGITPLGRVGLPSDIGRVVGFLASDDGEWVNGKLCPSDLSLRSHPQP